MHGCSGRCIVLRRSHIEFGKYQPSDWLSCTSQEAGWEERHRNEL